ncbi:hypothetical protein FNH04_34520 [Streptomyces phyllanthi]|uniref:Uncharacterized protein n=1 Tax=Streptomyces phyllanthi TaxID=1803180 RepID=A0A5N8WBJ5_9ACTN|nr:hypothetical protein [Streptomyces phyllanthi]
MRHTVRRSSRGVEQTGPNPRSPVRAACVAGSGAAASWATPGWLDLETTRISHKVPEWTSDDRA